MHEISILKDQQVHFGFMDVILLRNGHQHVSAPHVAIFRVVRTRIRIVVEHFWYIHQVERLLASVTGASKPSVINFTVNFHPRNR